MACCHDHDHGEGADAIPVVLCLANKDGTRLYWGASDPAGDPAHAHQRPRAGDLLVHPSASGHPSVHRYAETGWEPRLDAADGPDGPRPGGTGTPWPGVSLSKVREAARKDPGRPQGGTTPGASEYVRIVEDALRKEGLLDARWAGDGSFGTKTVEAYAAWQRRLGYRGSAADGIPGRTSLTMLGRAWGFVVRD